MIRVRCTTVGCVATAHVGADGVLPIGWSVDPAGRHRCPRHGYGDVEDAALRMPRGAVSRVRGRLVLANGSAPEAETPGARNRTTEAGRGDDVVRWTNCALGESNPRTGHEDPTP